MSAHHADETPRGYRPPTDHTLGILGGPILPREIRDDIGDLVREPGRYVALVSLLAPSSQKLAATVLWAGADDSVTLIDVATRAEILADEARSGSLTYAALAEGMLEHAVRASHGIRLPLLVDTVTGRVSNDIYTLPWRIATQLHASGHPLSAVASESHEARTARVAREERLFHALHAGVYRAGFLTDQKEYDTQVEEVGLLLAEWNSLLETRNFLSGETPGLDDLWGFTLIVRFDHVYGPLFRVHRHRITDFPALLAWARRLYSDPVLYATTDFDAITAGYYDGIRPLRREVTPAGVRDRHLIEPHPTTAERAL